MLKYDIIKIKTHPDLALSVWFRDGVEGKIRLLPQHLHGVLQPLTEQKIFEKAYIEDNVVRWSNNIDISPESMYHAITTQQQVGCVIHTAPA